MAEVPQIGGGNEDVVFSSTDFSESATVDPIKEVKIVSDEKKSGKGKGSSGSILENKNVALVIGIIGFVVIIIVFGLLFGGLDWELILNPPAAP